MAIQNPVYKSFGIMGFHRVFNGYRGENRAKFPIHPRSDLALYDVAGLIHVPLCYEKHTFAGP